MKTRAIALAVCTAALPLLLTACIQLCNPSLPWAPDTEHALPLVDLQGHPLSASELPVDSRDIATIYAEQDRSGAVSYAGLLELPPEQANEYLQVAVITDGAAHHRVDWQPETGRLFVSISEKCVTPWRLEANKIGYTPIILDLSTEGLSGKIVWIGSYTLIPSTDEDATEIRGEIVDAAKNVLAVSGSARLYLSGSGGDAEHYATDISNGTFLFNGISPNDYYFSIDIPGFNTFNLCIDTRKNKGSISKHIRAYPRMELRLNEIDGTTQTVQMGRSQNDRMTFHLQDGSELLLSQYGNTIIFRVSKGGSIAVAHCPGPYDSPESVLARVSGKKQWYGQWSGDIASDDLIVLLKDDTLHSVIRVDDIHPISEE